MIPAWLNPTDTEGWQYSHVWGLGLYITHTPWRGCRHCPVQGTCLALMSLSNPAPNSSNSVKSPNSQDSVALKNTQKHSPVPHAGMSCLRESATDSSLAACSVWGNSGHQESETPAQMFSTARGPTGLSVQPLPVNNCLSVRGDGIFPYY